MLIAHCSLLIGSISLYLALSRCIATAVYGSCVAAILLLAFISRASECANENSHSSNSFFSLSSLSQFDHLTVAYTLRVHCSPCWYELYGTYAHREYFAIIHKFSMSFSGRMTNKTFSISAESERHTHISIYIDSKLLIVKEKLDFVMTYFVSCSKKKGTCSRQLSF